MQRVRITTVAAAAIAALAFAGCGKDDTAGTQPAPKKDDEAQNTATEVNKPDPKPEVKQPMAAPDADYLWVWASHTEKKPGDPVKVAFSAVTVTKADFDPKNLEGATAELEIDLSNLSSGLDKRDGHLKSPDYLDVAKAPKATVKVMDVKKKGDTTYTANAEVGVHGVTKKMPVEFSVVGSDDAMVKIKATHAFTRADFSIGKADGDPVAPELKLEMQLTLKKS